MCVSINNCRAPYKALHVMLKTSDNGFAIWPGRVSRIFASAAQKIMQAFKASANQINSLIELWTKANFSCRLHYSLFLLRQPLLTSWNLIELEEFRAMDFFYLFAVNQKIKSSTARIANNFQSFVSTPAKLYFIYFDLSCHLQSSCCLAPIINIGQYY